MNYRFENIYTQAESIRWQTQAASKIGSNKMSLTSSYLVFIIQFCLWAPVLYFISPLELSFITKAIILFASYFFIGTFYDTVIHPHISARFDKKDCPGPEDKSRSIIEIDNEKIRSRDDEHEIIFKWSNIRAVDDDEKTVFLLTKNGYCLIPCLLYTSPSPRDS